MRGWRRSSLSPRSRLSPVQECLLLFDRAVSDGTQNLRIKPCAARQLLGIGVVALAITMRYRSKLTDIRNDNVMTQLLELFADPDRVRSRLHHHSCRRHIGKPLLQSPRCSSETSSIDHFSFFVKRAVMAPDISKVDTDRHLDPSRSAWNFRDEVLRWLFHG
jgi:hypothetical protein